MREIAVDLHIKFRKLSGIPQTFSGIPLTQREVELAGDCRRFPSTIPLTQREVKLAGDRRRFPSTIPQTQREVELVGDRRCFPSTILLTQRDPANFKRDFKC